MTAEEQSEGLTKDEMDALVAKLNAFGETLTPKEKAFTEAAFRSGVTMQEPEEVGGYMYASEPVYFSSNPVTISPPPPPPPDSCSSCWWENTGPSCY